MHIYLLTEHSIWIDRLVANSCDAIVSTQNLISTFPDPVRAKQVKQGCVNLFELRAHLLSRQCSLLQALDKINSLPRRGVQMIGRVIKEARSLHVCPFETYYTQFDLNWAYQSDCMCSIPNIDTRAYSSAPFLDVSLLLPNFGHFPSKHAIGLETRGSDQTAPDIPYLYKILSPGGACQFLAHSCKTVFIPWLLRSFT